MTDTNKTSGAEYDAATAKALADALDRTIARSSDRVKAACGFPVTSGADVMAVLSDCMNHALHSRLTAKQVDALYCARTAVAALIEREAALVARNAELEAERDDWNGAANSALALAEKATADLVALRETLAILKANAFKTAPLPGRPATGAQWFIGFATDNLALSFDQVFDNAIAVARASAATGGGSDG